MDLHPADPLPPMGFGREIERKYCRWGIVGASVVGRDGPLTEQVGLDHFISYGCVRSCLPRRAAWRRDSGLGARTLIGTGKPVVNNM